MSKERPSDKEVIAFFKGIGLGVIISVAIILNLAYWGVV